MIKIIQSFTGYFFLNKKNVLLLTFFIAFIIRLFFIFTNHSKNNWIDLSIYRNGGQLIVYGINPYNYKDGIEIRNELRLDRIAANSWVDETQERWDYYASSNLPLSLIYYGLIYKLSDGSALSYRIFFSLIDAILSTLIAFIIYRFWRLRKTFANLIIVLGVGALSPSFLHWGCIIPEDKGLQILLMLLAIYFAKEKKILPSSIFLGCSIAFKGLGIFIIPICFFFILEEPQKLIMIGRNKFKRVIIYSFLCIVFAVIWFIPYIPDVVIMIQNRLNSNLGATSEPIHGSIWVLLFHLYPKDWSTIKNIVIMVISLFWVFTFFVKKLNIFALSIFLLVLFVDLLLLQGSMDRMNIGIIVSVVYFYLIDVKYSRILAWYTIIAGIVFYAVSIKNGSINETTDAKFITGYLALFSFYPIYYLFIKNKLADRNLNNEA